MSIGARMLLGGILVWVLALAALTHARARVWTSNLTLWTDAAAKAPQKPRPWINLGLAREQVGDLNGALYAHQTSYALAAQPRLTTYQQAFSRIASETNIARMLAQAGQTDAALAILSDVLRRYPGFPHAHWNRAVLYARTGHCELALPDFQIAAALDAAFVVPGQCP